MELHVEQVGKRYGYEWIFYNVNFHFQNAQHCALTGPNGSGKSTFLQLLASHSTPSKGQITYQHKGQNIEVDQVYQYLSWAAPYMELIEEFTLEELLKFHFHFKSTFSQMSFNKIIGLIGLEKARKKPIKQYSSGMKQRVKLGLAIFSQTPLLILDEPLTNLDQAATDWYHHLIKTHCQNRTLIIASNRPEAYHFCQRELCINNFKDQ